MTINFNPRRHTGGDPGSHGEVAEPDDFNPRRHTGGDGMALRLIGALIISIHAATRAATDRLAVAPGNQEISIHAATRAATGGDLSGQGTF